MKVLRARVEINEKREERKAVRNTNLSHCSLPSHTKFPNL